MSDDLDTLRQRVLRPLRELLTEADRPSADADLFWADRCVSQLEEAEAGEGFPSLLPDTFRRRLADAAGTLGRTRYAGLTAASAYEAVCQLAKLALSVLHRLNGFGSIQADRWPHVAAVWREVDLCKG